VFIFDLVCWFVTGFSLLTLVCSASFVVYISVRKMFEIVFAISLPRSLADLTRFAPSDMVPASPSPGMIMAPVDKNLGVPLRGISAPNAAAIVGPWGPIDRGLSPEIVQKIERVMAVGVGMRDATGNLCPHPIAPRVALAIVEALQAHR
jgi:hypothetical protein